MARRNAARADGASTGSAEHPPPLRLGAVAGATPGKWIQHWREQRLHQPLELVPLEVADQVGALRDGLVDVAICRGRPTGDDLHVVALYDEIPVVVMSAESHLTVVDELSPEDLAGEVLIRPLDDVLGALDLPTRDPSFAAIATTEDAIATAATGAAIVVTPMSLARLHHPKDATYRPLTGREASPVTLVWLRERDGDDIQAFVGITRGRTARSSR